MLSCVMLSCVHRLIDLTTHLTTHFIAKAAHHIIVKSGAQINLQH